MNLVLALLFCLAGIALVALALLAVIAASPYPGFTVVALFCMLAIVAALTIYLRRR